MFCGRRSTMASITLLEKIWSSKDPPTGCKNAYQSKR
jgi:hypothetical protein